MTVDTRVPVKFGAHLNAYINSNMKRFMPTKQAVTRSLPNEWFYRHNDDEIRVWLLCTMLGCVVTLTNVARSKMHQDERPHMGDDGQCLMLRRFIC